MSLVSLQSSCAALSMSVPSSVTDALERAGQWAREVNTLSEENAALVDQLAVAEGSAVNVTEVEELRVELAALRAGKERLEADVELKAGIVTRMHDELETSEANYNAAQADRDIAVAESTPQKTLCRVAVGNRAKLEAERVRLVARVNSFVKKDQCVDDVCHWLDMRKSWC